MSSLQTLTLAYLGSLTSVEGLSGLSSLQTLEFKASPWAPMDQLISLPNLSALTGLEVKYQCQPRLTGLLQAWVEGDLTRRVHI